MVVPIELLRILGIAQRSGEIGHRNSRVSHNSKCQYSESQRDTIYQREYIYILYVVTQLRGLLCLASQWNTITSQMYSEVGMPLEFRYHKSIMQPY